MSIPSQGTRAPDLNVLDEDGAARTLDSLMGPAGLVLVFYRGAW